MITTNVPAQITSVEDRVTGKITVMQFALLSAPLLLGCFCFIILPPFFGLAIYKVIIIGLIALLCGTLAIRIKGKIILSHLVVFSKYYLRSRYYVYTKNTLDHKVGNQDRLTNAVSEQPESVKPNKKKQDKISTQDLIASEQSLGALRKDNLEFKVGKYGEVYAVLKTKS